MKIENKGIINTYEEAETPVPQNSVKYTMIGKTPLMFSIVGIVAGCIYPLIYILPEHCSP